MSAKRLQRAAFLKNLYNCTFIYTIVDILVIINYSSVDILAILVILNITYY